MMKPENRSLDTADVTRKGNGAPQFMLGTHFGSVSGTTLFFALMATLVIGFGIALVLMYQHFEAQESAGGKVPMHEVGNPAAVPIVPVASAAKSPAPISVAQARQQPFSPPSEASMPDGEYGKVVRLGQNVFLDTKKYAGKFVGNDLSCANCHLDAGRKPGAAPLWAAFIHYPAFRNKTGKVDTFASRIQGCFEYSMNGTAPQQDDEIMTALQAYAFWLATGAPVGTLVEGSGYPKLKPPPLTASYERGEKVYNQNCALCHGADGAGQRAGDQQVFPPLWGPRSFNWGAGMHQLANAAGFIKANMPLGKGNSLSEQEAWDVAMFMNSHERPQDPRFFKSVAETRKRYHDTPDSLYGTKVNGHILGSKEPMQNQKK